MKMTWPAPKGGNPSATPLQPLSFCEKSAFFAATLGAPVADKFGKKALFSNMCSGVADRPP